MDSKSFRIFFFVMLYKSEFQNRKGKYYFCTEGRRAERKIFRRAEGSLYGLAEESLFRRVERNIFRRAQGSLYRLAIERESPFGRLEESF